MQRQFINSREAAEIAGLHPETIRGAIRSGELRGRKVGNRFLTKPAWLEEWLGGPKPNQRRKPPPKGVVDLVP